MTPAEFKKNRIKTGMSQQKFAEFIGLGEGGGNQVRRWEMDPSNKSARRPSPIACRILSWLAFGKLKV